MLVTLRVLLSALVAILVYQTPGCCGSLIHTRYNASLVASIPSIEHYGVDGYAEDHHRNIIYTVPHFLLLNHSSHSATPQAQKQQSCSVGEHRCYDDNVYRVSQIKPGQCTGTFTTDDDFSESKPDPSGFWSASSYLKDSFVPWWYTRVDGIPLDSTRCEQVGLKTPTYVTSIDWLNMYAWVSRTSDCITLFGNSGASAVRMECMDSSGNVIPVIFFWHMMPVNLATAAPTGATTVSTISRLGLEYQCQWSWSVVLIDLHCGPYHPIVKGGDCRHSFCVKKP